MPTTLGLQTVAKYSSSAAEPPVPIVFRVTGTAFGDWIHIERLGTAEFQWCVVWYSLEGAQWRRIAKVERLFDTAEAALEAVAAALHPMPPAMAASR
jgi:hypothetical protein